LGGDQDGAWLAYIFFVQNLFHITLPPALAPSWALAIEEQYYFVWAPLVRFVRHSWLLTMLLVARLSLRRRFGSAIMHG